MTLSDRVTPAVMLHLRDAVNYYIDFVDYLDVVRNALKAELPELTEWVRQNALAKGEVHNDELDGFEEEFREWLDTREAKNAKV